MLRRLRIENNKLVEADEANGCVWVYTAPTEAEKRYLVDTMKLDEHTLNSSLDPEELSRLEFEPEHVALIFKRPRNYSSEDNFLFKVASTGVFFFKDRVIVVMAEDAPIFEGKPFARINSLHEIVLKMVYRSIYHFEEHLRVIQMISTQLEQEIATAMENKHLLNLFTLEKSLTYYVNGISTNAVLIDKLKSNAGKIGFSPENTEFLDDIIIENNQCREQANVYAQVLASLMDARVSIVSNNLNVLMKTLTMVMIAIMLPNLVVSLFSMNVEFPGREHPLAFWGILLLAGLSTAIVWMIWKYKKL